LRTRFPIAFISLADKTEVNAGESSCPGKGLKTALMVYGGGGEEDGNLLPPMAGLEADVVFYIDLCVFPAEVGRLVVLAPSVHRCWVAIFVLTPFSVLFSFQFSPLSCPKAYRGPLCNASAKQVACCFGCPFAVRVVSFACWC